MEHEFLLLLLPNGVSHLVLESNQLLQVAAYPLLELALHSEEAVEDLPMAAEILELEHLRHYLQRCHLSIDYLSKEAQVVLAIDLQVEVLRETVLAHLAEAARHEPPVDQEFAHKGQDPLLAVFFLVLREALLVQAL